MGTSAMITLSLSVPWEQMLTGDIPEHPRVSVLQSGLYFRSTDLEIKRFTYWLKWCSALLFSFGFHGNVLCELFDVSFLASFLCKAASS